MVVLNTSGEEINAKIVYYGPGVSGKTTNLEYIHEKMPVRTKGKLVSMKTRTDRTLFFDFLPLELGEINGYRTRFLLYTVPGQVYYNATRKLVLNGSDAVVFVADSSRAKLKENIESLRNLEDNLNEHGMSLDHIPWVIQYNKRDVPDAMSIDELHDQLNLLGVPAYEAIAIKGTGVYETFQGIAALLYDVLKRRLERGNGAPEVQAAGKNARADHPSVAVESALRESPSPAPVAAEREYQEVGSLAATSRPAPVLAPAPHVNRAQSVGSPGSVRGAANTAGQPAASAPETVAPRHGAREAPESRLDKSVDDDAFGFQPLPSTADANDRSSEKRIAEAMAASEAARGEATPEFILDPMGRKPRVTAAPESRPARPEPHTVELINAHKSHTVELHDARTPDTIELRDARKPNTSHFEDAAVPEMTHPTEITVPVTIAASLVRPGKPIRLLLDIEIVED